MDCDREPREARLLIIRVRSGGSSSYAARLHNLNSKGLSATLERPAAVGDRLVFELNGIGSVAGTVRWIHLNRVGVSLDHAIDPRKVVREGIAPVCAPPVYAEILFANVGTGRRPGLRTG